MHGIAVQVIVAGVVLWFDEAVVRQGAVFDVLKEVIHSLELLRERIDILIAQAGDPRRLRQAIVIDAPILARVL